MKDIKRIIVALIMLCFVFGCKREIVDNVDVVEENPVEIPAPAKDTSAGENEDVLIGHGVDNSNIENQIIIIFDYISENGKDDIKYYTIADLNNNGRAEILLTSVNDVVDFYEISEDYQSLNKNGAMSLFVSGPGGMTLKLYEYEDDSNNSYVGYDSFGCKYIYYIKSDGLMTSKMIFNPGLRPILFMDGNNGILVSDKSNVLSESEKAENDYFVDAIGKKIITLDWYEKNDCLDVESLLELYEKTTFEECPDMDEWDGLYGFTGERAYLADKQDLSDSTLDLFEICALYLDPDYDLSKGDILSSKGYDEIKDFLFYLRCDDVETVQEFDYDHNTMIHRISYVNLDYFLSKVCGEKNTECVVDKLKNTGDGEIRVYYNENDGYMYQEAGMVTLGEEYTQVKNVSKTNDEYVITYMVISDFSGYQGTIDVTIVKDENRYGYRLKDIGELNLK